MTKVFDLHAPFQPTGDQPEAINKLTEGILRGDEHQTLLGGTGSGKTFAAASVIDNIGKPTLVIAHNKTLAAQLAAEFRDFFPNNAVEYFVSYYDYYQPEAYIPQSNTYIEKDSDVNEEIDRLRLAATRAILTRKDVIIVASVSCIYGLGSPENYQNYTVALKVGDRVNLADIYRQLIHLQYDRNDTAMKRGVFRVKGDLLEIYPAYEQFSVRISFFGDEVEKIATHDGTTGDLIEVLPEVTIFPAKHYMAPIGRLDDAVKGIEHEMVGQVKKFKSESKLLEAQRIEERTHYDLELLQELGYCSGIENYSLYLDGRKVGEPPYTLLDYFIRASSKDGYLTIIDESHITVPQIRGMYNGDRARKETLVDFGFRLPSALDNRPLKFDEFLRRTNQTIYTSATPSDYELRISTQVAEQIIRPTGIVDPVVEVRPTKAQIPNLQYEINERVKSGQRVLVTTLTKRNAEDLSQYLTEMGVKVMYIHSDVDTLDRIDILRDLRLGIYDVLIGINLLREGLDLPEVSLVAILDADKEGFLRSRTSLIQTIGRAARHVDGKAIMYADRITDSMRLAIDETKRRREIQEAYNEEHSITPQSIIKAVKDISQRVKELQPSTEETSELDISRIKPSELHRLVKELEADMKRAATELDFERATLIRDQIIDLKREIATQEIQTLVKS
jgi:excinuclease ABC subunit B